MVKRYFEMKYAMDSVFLGFNTKRDFSVILVAYMSFSRNPFKQKKLIINDFIPVIAQQAQLQRLSSKTGGQT